MYSEIFHQETTVASVSEELDVFCCNVLLKVTVVTNSRIWLNVLLIALLLHIIMFHQETTLASSFKQSKRLCFPLPTVASNQRIRLRLIKRAYVINLVSLKDNSGFEVQSVNVVVAILVVTVYSIVAIVYSITIWIEFQDKRFIITLLLLSFIFHNISPKKQPLFHTEYWLSFNSQKLVIIPYCTRRCFT